jgi:peptidoglycan/LPS O-acetylase OafA/YrhL
MCRSVKHDHCVSIPETQGKECCAVSVATEAGQPNARYSRKHVASLDGVRGVAILLVLLYHSTVSLGKLGLSHSIFSPLLFGWCGVDVFFTLSGFLITGILLDTKEDAGYFRNFYGRRILRIFPLYYGAIFVVFLIQAWLSHEYISGQVGGLLAPGSLLWPALFLENIVIFRHGASTTGILTHFWSLAVEEHFYLIWPLVVWLGTRRQIIIIALFAILLSVLGRWGVYLSGYDIGAAFGVTLFRMDGLAMGALASLAIRGSWSLAAVARWAWIVLAVAAALLLGLILVRRTLHQTDPGIWIFAYTLIAATTAAGIVAAMAPGLLRRTLSEPILCWFGKYSFGLYVWHPIIGVILLHTNYGLVPEGAGKIRIMLVFAFVLALELAAAWLSFHLFEKRFLNLKRYFVGGRARNALIPATSDGRA